MANENERNDISLCFQALGIEFGAPPEEVEKAYQRMLAEIKKKQTSGDPAQRAEAANDLELAHDLYEKIRNSVTYSTRLKEASQTAAMKQQVQQQQKKEAAQQFKICPSCSKTIGAALKKCPYCREPIRTPLEKFINNIFSGKALLIIIILLTIVAGIIFLTNPDLLKKTEQPASADNIKFSNTSGSGFSNLSGAALKP